MAFYVLGMPIEYTAVAVMFLRTLSKRQTSQYRSLATSSCSRYSPSRQGNYLPLLPMPKIESSISLFTNAMIPLAHRDIALTRASPNPKWLTTTDLDDRGLLLQATEVFFSTKAHFNDYH
jgi:hypothetical protein